MKIHCCEILLFYIFLWKKKKKIVGISRARERKTGVDEGKKAEEYSKRRSCNDWIPLHEQVNTTTTNRYQMILKANSPMPQNFRKVYYWHDIDSMSFSSDILIRNNNNNTQNNISNASSNHVKYLKVACQIFILIQSLPQKNYDQQDICYLIASYVLSVKSEKYCQWHLAEK